MIRFIHTSDWQLGMSRRYLRPEAQARFDAARVAAIDGIASLVGEEQCAFVVVCGDAFESNQVDRQTVVRALDALSAVPAPVFLLPGNHDPYDASSVYASPSFLRSQPPNVHVLASFDALEAVPGVWLHPAPWHAKKSGEDLVARAIGGARADGQGHALGARHVVVGHGAVDALSPSRDDPARILLAPLEAVTGAGMVDYVALGDCHSTTEVGATRRVWYCGTPEATDFGEQAAGNVLMVSLADAPGDPPTVHRRRLGRWAFMREQLPMNGHPDVEALVAWLNGIEGKSTTVLKLGLQGTIAIREKAELDEELAHFADLFGCLLPWESESELAVIAEEEDFAGLGLTGFAASATDELRAMTALSDDSAETARDALALLVRLAGARDR